MKRIAIILATMALATIAALAQSGTWKAYLAYSDVSQIERDGNTLYVLASNDLYSYNRNDNSITTYDKTNGLSDCYITRIGWNSAAHKLLIVYSNGNIDMLARNGDISNLPDYYSKTMTEDKTVNSIYMYGTAAYVSTAFGILNIDMDQEQITNTYNLGFRVDYCYIEGGYIYAASSTNGLYRAQLTANLLDPNNWTRTGGYQSRDNSIDPELLAEVSTLSPGGPQQNYFGKMKYENGKLYTITGTRSGVELPGLIQVYDGNDWTFSDTYEQVNSQTGYRFSSLYGFDVDPTDPNHICVACQSGLYEFNNLRFTRVWNYNNSPLQTAATLPSANPDYVLTTGTIFDQQGNQWVLNSVAPSSTLLFFSHDGQWTSHHKQELMRPTVGYSMDNMVNPMWDSRGLLWFVNDFWYSAALACYQPSTDAIRVYTSFVNEDGTTVTVGGGVRCVAEDKDNNIWMGTNVGPMLLTPDDITSGSNIFTQVKVPRNDGTNLADYLLDNVDITCIAVDGGNRKWFGTNGNGVFLISSDNMTQLEHFTAENSKLLSDNISSIAIDQASGEVYFGTFNGLCSYQSGATEPVEKMDKDVTYAYPNPVRPGYTGPITIVGLSYNADVKIVTTSGTLVAEGKSNGGSFQWDGCDKKGKRVASGVYMVETATSSGDSGTVCKIAIVN